MNKFSIKKSEITTGVVITMTDKLGTLETQPIEVVGVIKNKKDTKRPDGSVRSRDYSGFRVRFQNDNIETVIESGNLIASAKKAGVAEEFFVVNNEEVSIAEGSQLGWDSAMKGFTFGNVTKSTSGL